MTACWPCSDPASPWNCGVPGAVRYGRIALKRTGRFGTAPALVEEIKACPGCNRYSTDDAARAAWERAQREKEKKA